MTSETDPTDDETEISAAEQRSVVRERYGSIATDASSCCDGADSAGGTDCCGDPEPEQAGDDALSRSLGYSDEEVDAVASGANLGLSCGNPTAIANLEPGETVLDLGSGGGFDCFLAANEVGSEGQVIAVSDVVQTAPFPSGIELDPSSVAGCVAGASTIAEIESMLDDAGFTDVAVEPKADSEEFIRDWDDDRDVSEYVVAATIEGRKPRP